MNYEYEKTILKLFGLHITEQAGIPCIVRDTDSSIIGQVCNLTEPIVIEYNKTNDGETRKIIINRELQYRQEDYYSFQIENEDGLYDIVISNGLNPSLAIRRNEKESINFNTIHGGVDIGYYQKGENGEYEQHLVISSADKTYRCIIREIDENKPQAINKFELFVKESSYEHEVGGVKVTNSQLEIDRKYYDDHGEPVDSNGSLAITVRDDDLLQNEKKRPIAHLEHVLELDQIGLMSYNKVWAVICEVLCLQNIEVKKRDEDFALTKERLMKLLFSNYNKPRALELLEENGPKVLTLKAKD